MKEMMSNLKKASNKDVSTYPGVVTESFNGKERISNTRKYLNNKCKHRKKLAKKSITKRDEEIKSTYVGKLSNCNLTTDRINPLSKGLRFIPPPHTLIVLKNKFYAISISSSTISYSREIS